MLLRATIFLSLILLFNFYSTASDLPQKAEKGESIFLQKCASCHSVGKGKLVGPDLKGVTERRDEKWLKSFIKDPKDFFDKKEKIAMELLKDYNIQMPALGLSDNEIELIMQYFKAQTGKETGPVPGDSKVIFKGNKDTGMALFTGSAKFQNDGPACISCHTIAGINMPGGALGPELTKAGETYGRDGISSVLKDIPFPTMQPVYSNKPLTDEEGANLGEFIAGVNTSVPAKSFKDSVFLITAGIVIFVAIMQVAWGGRLKNVRRTLVNNTMRKEVS